MATLLCSVVWVWILLWHKLNNWKEWSWVMSKIFHSLQAFIWVHSKSNLDCKKEPKCSGDIPQVFHVCNLISASSVQCRGLLYLGQQDAAGSHTLCTGRYHPPSGKICQGWPLKVGRFFFVFWCILVFWLTTVCQVVWYWFDGCD